MTGRILYYGKKVLLFVLSVFLLSAAVFCVSRLAPGDPLVSYYGDRVEKMTPAERAWAEEKLGLNAEVIGSRAGNTLLLGGVGFLLIFVCSPLLGILCAWFEDRPLDRILCRLGTAASCIPEFWLSLVLILVFSAVLRWLPSSGAYSIGGGGVGDRIIHLILPLTVVVASHLWYYAYLIRNRILEEVRAGTACATPSRPT